MDQVYRVVPRLAVGVPREEHCETGVTDTTQIAPRVTARTRATVNVPNSVSNLGENFFFFFCFFILALSCLGSCDFTFIFHRNLVEAKI